MRRRARQLRRTVARSPDSSTTRNSEPGPRPFPEVEASKRVNVDDDHMRTCPRCLLPMMRHFESPRRTVTMDECPECGGTWLDPRGTQDDRNGVALVDRVIPQRRAPPRPPVPFRRFSLPGRRRLLLKAEERGSPRAASRLESLPDDLVVLDVDDPDRSPTYQWRAIDVGRVLDIVRAVPPIDR